MLSRLESHILPLNKLQLRTLNFTQIVPTARVTCPPADSARAPYSSAQNLPRARVTYPPAEYTKASYFFSRRNTSARVPYPCTDYASALDPLGRETSEPYQPKTLFSHEFEENKLRPPQGVQPSFPRNMSVFTTPYTPGNERQCSWYTPTSSELSERFLPKPSIEVFDGDPLHRWGYLN